MIYNQLENGLTKIPKAVELVQKYLNIIKTKLNQKKASLKAQVKTKKPKKTRKKKIKKKTKKRKLKVKIGGGEPEPEPGTDDDICGICLDILNSMAVKVVKNY